MKQKGQVEILILILVVVGFLAYQWWRGEIKLWEPAAEKGAPSPESPVRQVSAPPSPKQSLSSPPPKTEEIEVEKDTTPPSRSNPSPTGDLAAETRKINLSLLTNEKAICRYGQVSGLSYDAMQDLFQKTSSTTHSTEIGFLSEGEKYNFYIKCEDEFGNKNIDDFEISFSVKKAADKTPPERKWLSPSGMLHASTTQVELTCGTDERASCYYSNLQGKDFWQKSGSFQANETGTYHTAKIYNLTSQTIYDYFVRCCDTAGNCNEGDALIRFGIGIEP